ncbi:MAG: hypothetical protein ACE5PV_19400 [Candidatus Poribacteria bacterium]
MAETINGKAEEELKGLMQNEEISPDVRKLAEVFMGWIMEEQRGESAFGRIESQLEASDEKFRATLQEIGALRQEMKIRFEASDKRFEALQREIETRFEALDKRFEVLQEGMNARFEASDKRFETLQKEMNTRFEALQKEMNMRFETSIGVMEARFESADARFESLEARFRMLLWWIPLWFTVLNAFTALLLKLLKLI